MDADRLISDRCKGVQASGIRRVFELGAQLTNPVDLSIGQPDFPVPDPVKRAAIEAIEQNRNGYTLSQGVPALRQACSKRIADDLGWPSDTGAPQSDVGLMVTTGTSGALFLMMMALLSPGDEIIIPDPYFVAYPSMASICGGVAVRCDTYPDFRMTAERVEPLITKRTKAVLLNSPGNPTGVVMSQRECRELLELCRRKGIVLISDEIYDEFCFADAQEGGNGGGVCPSPAREPNSHNDVLVIRGFGKTYGCTGWRMGFVAGPKWLITEMTKMQQFTYVCAPAPLQWGCIPTFDVDMAPTVQRYAKRRDMVTQRLGEVTDVARPGGAFYAFVKVPGRMNMTGQQFFEKALQRNLLLIPGGVFSDRDTHFRISYATAPDKLERGLEVLVELMKQ